MKIIKTDQFTVIENKDKKLILSWIFQSGFLNRESDFAVGTEKEIKNRDEALKFLNKTKWAVFNIKRCERITQYYDWISPLGLVKGQSEFFRVTEKGKEALFSLEGRKTEWFDKIRDRGALTGESCYFWGKKDGYYALYDINTGERLTDHFKSSVIAGAVIGRSDYVIGSYGNEIFFIYDIKTRKKVSDSFDEDRLIQILKNDEDLENLVRKI